MANVQFELDKIRRNENYIVRIVLGGKIGTVVGFLRQEFSIAGEPDYTSPFESSALEGANDKIQAVTSTIDRVTGSGLSGHRLSNILGSAAIWRSTKKPTFSISLLFVAIKPTDNVVEPVRKLQRALYPRVSIGGVGMKAPMGYHMPKGKIPPLASAQGTSIIQVGKWFRAPGQLITGVNPSFSKEVIQGGKPLYATVELQFAPWRLVTEDEIVEFFLV